jgi:single-strand DNA-binding protein
MAYDNTVTIVGNLTRDPELRFTPSGAAVASFGVAWNLKGRDGQEDKVSYFDVTCWRQLAGLRRIKRLLIWPGPSAS